MPFKTTLLSLSASLAFHTVIAVSFSSPVWQDHDAASRLVEISYVRYPESPRPPAPPQIQYPPMAKRLPASRQAGVALYPAPSGDRFPKMGSMTVKNGEEFLTDPQKGKIFLNYFGRVKERVRRAVEKGYGRDRPGRGDVTLMFVLKADGAVVKVVPVDKSSGAEEPLKDFAVRCVRECSPFPAFPKELGMERISFNLSILFDET